MNNKVNVFIVGAPKCGTTALMKYLTIHSDVFFPKLLLGNTGKVEPNYFARDLLVSSDPYYTKEKYVSLYKDAPGDTLWGDASVYHLLSATAAQNIHDYNPDAKIIIMLRNPVDFLFSYFKEMRFHGYEKEDDLLTVLRLGRELKYSAEKRNYRLRYMELATFSEQIERYLALFPINNIKFIKFDDFVGDTRRTFYDVLSFLDLSNDGNFSFEVVNPSKRVRSKVLRTVITSRPRIIRMVFHWVFPKKEIRSFICSWVARLERRVNTSKNSERLTNEVRCEIINQFENEVERLQVATDLDLQNWKSV